VTREIEEPSAGLAPGTGGTPRRRKRGANKQLANGLVALSSAAIVAVYAAGYARTAPAAASLASGDAAAIAVGATATTPSDTASPTATATTPSQIAAGRSSVAAAPTATTPAPTQTSQATQAAQSGAQSGATLRDGTYVGTGSSRHGSIQATVVVQGGRVVSANITGCGTRYPCSDIAMLPGQVVARQSAGVDFVSGATDSSIAYRAAVAAALAKAR
jgi:uncharacterized protein with FMN-binding domain